MRPAIEVGSAERAAAASWCASQPFPSKQVEAKAIALGEHDEHSLVQAFALYGAITRAELVADVFAYLIARSQEPEEFLPGSYVKRLHADERTAWLKKMQKEYNP